MPKLSMKLAAIAWLVLCHPAGAQTNVVTVNGFKILKDPSGALYSSVDVHGSLMDRIDIVFLAEGYTEAELGSFHTKVQEFQKELFTIEPFASNVCAFNLWMVSLVSNQSGISDPRASIDRDTALKSRFNNAGEPLMYVMAQGTLCWDAVDAAGVPACDFICVILNDTATPPHDGAWAYPDESVSYMSSGYTWGPVIAHELGHLIAGLGDEYTCYICDRSAGDSNRSYSTSATNASAAIGKPNLATDINNLPELWKSFLAVEIPTTPDVACSGNSIGAWEGGGTFKHGVYRPAEYCIMGGKMCSSEIFCWVCHELLAAAIPAPFCSDFVLWAIGEGRVRDFNDMVRIHLGPCLQCPPDSIVLHYEVKIIPTGFDPNIIRASVIDERGTEVAVGTPVGQDHIEIVFDASRLWQYSILMDVHSYPEDVLEWRTEYFINGTRQRLR